MRTVVLGEGLPGLQELIERRRALGQDLFDEVWEGEYHVAPAAHPRHGIVDQRLAVVLDPLARAAGLIVCGPFNLGADGDYRVPDRGVFRVPPSTTFVPTAALVVEVVSPHDESWAKLSFYADRGVDELLIADPITETVTILRLVDGAYEKAARSELLGVDVDVVAEGIGFGPPA